MFASSVTESPSRMITIAPFRQRIPVSAGPRPAVLQDFVLPNRRPRTGLDAISERLPEGRSPKRYRYHPKPARFAGGEIPENLSSPKKITGGSENPLAFNRFTGDGKVIVT